MISIEGGLDIKISDNLLKEDNLELIIDLFPEAIVITDLMGNIINCNNEAVNLTASSSKEELIGDNVFNFVISEEREEGIKSINKLLLNGVLRDIEYEGINKESKIIPIEISANVISDNSGYPNSFFCIIKDINKRKKAEEELKISDEWLNLAQKAANVGFWDWNIITGELTWSEELYNLFGLDPNTDPSFDIWLNIMNEDDRKSSMDNINRSIEEKKPLLNEYRIIHPDGKEHWIRALGDTFYNDSGDPERMIGICLDVTSDKEVENQLIKAYNYNRGLIESNLDPLVTIGSNGKITDVNSATEIVTGYYRDDLIGTDFSCYFTEPEKAREGYKKVFEDGTVKDYELQIKHKKGYITPVSYNASVYNDENGNIIGVFAAARDITELKVAEKVLKVAHDNLEIKVKERTNELEDAVNALSESKAQLRIAMDLAKIVSWEYDVKSDMFTFDDHFYALYCTTAKEEGGRQMSSEEYARRFIPSEESQVVEESITRALKTDDPDFIDTIEHSIIRADGQKRYIIVRYGLIKDNEGHTIKTYGANQDITERKELENRFLERSRRLNILNKIILAANRSPTIEFLLKDILDLILNLMYFDGGAIYLINEDTRIAEIKHFKGLSEDFKKFVGNIQIDEDPFNEVLVNGKPMFISKHDLDFPEFLKWNLKSYASIPIYSKNKVIGAFNIANKKSHYFTDGERQLMASIGREIGNSISNLLAEEEMKKLIKELKRSNEELEQFAYITSHDLQEPLRTIASFTQLLEIRYKDKLDSDADEFMGYMVDASIRMKDMIQGLLNYSRVGKEGMDLEPVNLEDIVNGALSNLKLVIDENNAEISYDALPSVLGDSKLLVQLFQNLISNAIKFKEDKPPKIHISASRNEKEDKYIISVEDNGIGIDPQYAKRIFKVFKRLHTLDEYKGAGIGLAISKRIIENHGGNIWVKSELNKGSKFYFTLNSVK